MNAIQTPDGTPNRSLLNGGKALSRRSFLLAASATAVALSVTSCASAGTGKNQGQVVVATYGGAMLDALKNVFFNDFTSKTGIQVITVEADEGRFVSMAKDGNSEWDSIDGAGFSVVNWMDTGVVQKLPADVPRASLTNKAYRDYAGWSYGQSYVLVYNKETFSTAPTSWTDVWDRERFPGKRGWPTDAYGALEAASLAGGIPKEQVYPLNFDRAFAKLDELRPDLTLYNSYAASIQGLQAGSVDMALVPNGRAYSLIQSDQRFGIMWEENIYLPSTYSLSAGAPNVDAMAQLFTFMADPERQARFAEEIGYAPCIPEAFELIAPEVLKQLPGTKEHMQIAFVVDEVALSKQNDELLKRYSTWIAG